MFIGVIKSGFSFVISFYIIFLGLLFLVLFFSLSVGMIHSRLDE